MRLLLKQSGQSALERLHGHCKALNPNAEPATGPFLDRFLVVLWEVLTKEQWDSIADQLTSETVKRRRKKQLLLALSEKVDVSDIESFARKVERKHSASGADASEKQLNSTDVRANS